MKNKIHSDYSFNVFINCPFDEEYKPLLHILIFTVHACGFIPRSALEYDDSDDVRILKIKKIISECQYGIHDLSLAAPRFNMPLELGIFIGCKQFGNPQQRNKKYLILENQPNQSKKFISDLGGQDVKAHENNPQRLIQGVRDWLSGKSKNTIPHASVLLDTFDRFKASLPAICLKAEWKEEELTFVEYSSLIVEWLRELNKKEE
ncbi:MAG: hypothetical protein MUF58_14865 [Arcicella sp.]|nr:hypothetical protein [Arcicella sp.]